MLYIGQPILYNAASSLRYGRELDAFYEAALRSVQKRVLKEYQIGRGSIYSAEILKNTIDDLTRRYEYALKTVGEQYANQMLEGELRQANVSMMKFGEDIVRKEEGGGKGQKRSMAQYSIALAMLAGIGIASVEQMSVFNACKMENLALQSAILGDFMTRALGGVSRGIALGSSYSQLRDEIINAKEKAVARAARIADDQSRKAFIAFTVAKMKQMGIRRFKWVHNYAGKEPREFHKRPFPIGLNGGIFSVDNPPVIDPNTGFRGYPGQLAFCRCTMAPVI